MGTLLRNMQHLLNAARPYQARSTLAHMLRQVGAGRAASGVALLLIFVVLLGWCSTLHETLQAHRLNRVQPASMRLHGKTQRATVVASTTHELVQLSGLLPLRAPLLLPQEIAERQRAVQELRAAREAAGQALQGGADRLAAAVVSLLMGSRTRSWGAPGLSTALSLAWWEEAWATHEGTAAHAGWQRGDNP